MIRTLPTVADSRSRQQRLAEFCEVRMNILAWTSKRMKAVLYTSLRGCDSDRVQVGRRLAVDGRRLVACQGRGMWKVLTIADWASVIRIVEKWWRKEIWTTWRLLKHSDDTQLYEASVLPLVARRIGNTVCLPECLKWHTECEKYWEIDQIYFRFD